MQNVTNIEALALSKLKLASGVRDEVSPGKYTGTVTVTVDYSLNVGEDYKQRIVAKADPWALLAVAMSKLNGVTVDSIVREATAGDINSAEIKTQADAAMATIKGETWTTCNGKVTGKATVTGKMVTP